MKLLLDMNLSPVWVRFLEENGFEAVHWSTTGEPTASDAIIVACARDNGFVVITHDLDFSALLASTEAAGPSVLQVRTQDVLPDSIGSEVVRVLRDHRAALDPGSRSAWISAAARRRCASTTGRLTRSGRRRTGYWEGRSPTWTATRRSGAARSRCSTGRDPLLRVLDSAEEECTVVGRWLAERAMEGVTAGGCHGARRRGGAAARRASRPSRMKATSRRSTTLAARNL
jgi:predicted nuclease of predicted toxin-antitoxin system